MVGETIFGEDLLHAVDRTVLPRDEGRGWVARVELLDYVLIEAPLVVRPSIVQYSCINAQSGGPELELPL